MTSFKVQDSNAVGATLSGAILLYSADGPVRNGALYATTHDVRYVDGTENNPGTPMICPGRPLDRKGLHQLVSELSGGTDIARFGYLPPNILALGPGYIVWYVPPGPRNVYFKTDDASDGKEVRVGKRSGKVPLPGLVFAATTGRNMWVFAVKGAARPAEDATMYYTPFMNVWADGRVCTGNMPLPADTTARDTAGWTNAFFRSYFTHPNHTRSVRYKGGSHAFWTDMLDGKFATFPEGVLTTPKNAKLVLSAFIEFLAKGARQ